MQAPAPNMVRISSADAGLQSVSVANAWLIIDMGVEIGHA